MNAAIKYDFLNPQQSLRLTRMLMKLLALWQLTYEEQAIALGFSKKTHSSISRYKKGLAPIRFDRDTYDRARFLLSIHKALKALFPKNPELACAWFKTPNRFFEQKAPMQIISEEGFLGLARVHSYLEHYLAN